VHHGLIRHLGDIPIWETHLFKQIKDFKFMTIEADSEHSINLSI